MEFAVVLPLFCLLVVGAIDVGRAIMVQQKLVEATRAGCRLSVGRGRDAEGPKIRAIRGVGAQDMGAFLVWRFPGVL